MLYMHVLSIIRKCGCDFFEGRMSNRTKTVTQIPQFEELFTSIVNKAISENELSGNRHQVEDKETYLERGLGFLIIGGIGIISNLFAIFILISSAKIRKKLVNTLIIHQSFVDLLACIALVGMAHLDGSDHHGLEGLHAEVYCFFVMCKLPLWLMMEVSSFSLIFINIERYISIVFPIYHHTNVSRKKVLMILPIVWILGIVEQTWVCSCFTAEDGACAFNNLEIFGLTVIVYLVLHFFLPVILVLFLYGHMFIRLRSSVKSGNNSTSNNRNEVIEKAKNNVFKTMLLITICYAVCYVFNSVYVTLFYQGVLKIVSGKYISHCYYYYYS